MLTRLLRFGPAVPRLISSQPVRFVSRSKPTGAAGSAAVTDLHAPVDQGGHAEADPYVKNRDFHGFSSDPEVDEWNMRTAFFCGISVALVFGGFFLAYLPDHTSWVRREAERVIVEREKAGLPLIDPDYYDSSKIILPTAGEE
ncbi:NADH dehydrogenase [ubiquinone] 1 beta subcomplex subunit 11, mitochondrial [Halichoeres trimaculatus]|uniref:NADH dehydrogenase [ubiquinone] 1 beta subcomplex subunit 11, mitochondrial n=1 Tax=Halichoeres trimaculatus TaxID=147232 RepID=UPI003D9F79AB